MALFGGTFVVIFFLVLVINRLIHGDQRSTAQLNRRPPISPEMRAAVYERARTGDHYLFACSYCQKTAFGLRGPDGYPWEVDHVVPYSWGGASDLSNLVLSCRTCNSNKGARVWTPRRPEIVLREQMLPRRSNTPLAKPVADVPVFKIPLRP